MATKATRRPALVVGYIRVSTDEQAREGCSLAFQREAIEAHAKVKGAELLGVFSDEGISGAATGNRPGLREALAMACDRGAALCVYSLSRAWRSTRDAIDGVDGLNRYGAELVSLSESIDTTTPAGRMTFRLFASLAEFERDTIRERVRAGMNRARREGRRLTRPERVPYGMRPRRDDPDRLERDPREYRILFIPFYNLYWLGTTLPRLTRALNLLLDQRHIDTQVKRLNENWIAILSWFPTLIVALLFLVKLTGHDAIPDAMGALERFDSRGLSVAMEKIKTQTIIRHAFNFVPVAGMALASVYVYFATKAANALINADLRQHPSA